MKDREKIRIRSEVGDELSAALPGLKKGSEFVSSIASDVLKSNLMAFMRNFEEVLESSYSEDSKYEVDSIELNLSVNADGGIELLGKLRAGTEASIKVTLKRKQAG